LAQLLYGSSFLSRTPFDPLNADIWFQIARNPNQRYAVCFFSKIIDFFNRLVAKGEIIANFVLYVFSKEWFQPTSHLAPLSLEPTLGLALV
jgi:hypothetical protein